MSNPTKTETIKIFLTKKTHPDLAKLYNYNMEVQVNVARGNGERIDGTYQGRQWHGWTDGTQTWKPIRIPWKANSDPTFKDSEMKYDLFKHAEGIGMTGWDWKNKFSRWVAFDFDSLSHSQGLSAEELLKISERAKEIPWVTVRKSTSGTGLHIYVFLDPVVPTDTHTEHAALARCIIGQMSILTDYDFSNKVDICGGNMWVWHRKMQDTDGLTLIKQGSSLSVDFNWRDNINIIKGHTHQVIPEGVEAQDTFLKLTGQQVKTPLDKEHKRLLEYFNENRCYWSWDQDANMLVTHTIHLKEAHRNLELKGSFETVSTGAEWGHDKNCFCYPLENGAWVVRRFQQGVTEAETWEVDGSGWTRCYFNKTSHNLVGKLAEKHGGKKHKGNKYYFSLSKDATKLAKDLGIDLDIPGAFSLRQCNITLKTDELVVEIKKERDDPTTEPELSDWIPEGNKWIRVYPFQASETQPFSEGYDDKVRHIVDLTNKDAGWVIHHKDSGWVEEPLTHVRLYLKTDNLKDSEANYILGNQIKNRWMLVNRPFQPEYPGNRLWNKDSAQLKYIPAKGDNLKHETWDMILNHVGKGYDYAIAEWDWAKENNIICGADYLKCWLAGLFQYPQKRLPYLFFYGPQNSGKTMFHEALKLLFTRNGYMRADNALVNPQGFNYELQYAVLCVIEEVDLSGKNKLVYNRAKDWITAEDILLHKKGATPYMIENTLHFIQCANERSYCYIPSDDSRVVVCRVDRPKNYVSKSVIVENCIKEAANFLGSLMSLELPKSYDRLIIPPLDTGEKIQAQVNNMSALETFVHECVHEVKGEILAFDEFFDRFRGWMEPLEASNWTKQKVSRLLPDNIIKGRNSASNRVELGNISFNPGEDQDFEWFVTSAGKLHKRGVS